MTKEAVMSPPRASIFEIENGQDQPTTTLTSVDNHQFLSPTAFAKIRYIILSSLAALFTVICPGRTIMWDSGKLSMDLLFQILLIDILVLISLFTLVGSDPGFLTQDIFDDDDDTMEDGISLLEKDEINNNNEEDNDNDQNNNNQDPLGQQSTATSRNMNGGGLDDFGASTAPLSTYRKPCYFCHLKRPPLRSHHCKVCNKCVATFDHHCKFLHTCIGERNYCRFYIFVLLNFIAIHLCLKVVNSSSYGFTTPFQTKSDSEYDDLWYFTLFVITIKVYLYLIKISAFVMCASHTYIILFNLSTFELNIGTNLDYMRDTRTIDCPFSRGGCLANIRLKIYLDSFCSSLPSPFRRSNNNNQNHWSPMIWKREEIIRDSDDWWNHPYENKYWSCC